MASGTGFGRRSRSMNWRKSLTIGHGRANIADAFHLTGRTLRYENGDLDEVAVNTTIECDDVSSVKVLEFLDVAGHPIAGECRLENLDYNGEGFRMAARRDYPRALRGPASESLPGRNPR